jgi:hypothetical protein
LDGADPAGMGTPPASGATVSTWNDKSGNGKNATATGTSTYISGGGVNFTGSSYFLNQTFAMNLSQRSIFVVFQETTTSYSAGVIVFIPTPNTGDDSGSTSGMTCEIGFPDNLWFYGNNDGYRSMIGGSHPLPKAIYHDSMNGTTGSGYLNGTNATNVTAGYTATTCSGYALGGRWQGGSMSASYRQNGVIYEILVYNSALTTSQRQQVEGYLAHKWGLQTSIPSTHPFYSVRPHLRAFQPIDVPGCALWLDAADSSTITLNGSTVSSWADKSGNGNIVTQATSANQPTYVTNVVNGNPVLRFNGTSHVLQKTSFTSLGTNSVSFWLVERNLSNSGGGAPFSFNSGPNNGIVFQNNNGLQPLPNSVPYTSSVARIVFYNRTNTGSGDSGYLNGTVVSIRDDNTTGTYGTTFAVGMRILSTIYTSGDICEILIFIGMPTVSERQQVEGYLAHKWGLTSRFSTPLTIPGCAMWLDGADPAGTGTPPVSGTTISTWVDKSGNSNNGTSGTAAFQTDALGGYINFTGSQSYVITNPNIVVNQYFTIFIVEQIGNVSPSQDYVLMKGSTNDNNRNLHIVYRGGSPVIAFAFYFNDLNVNISSYGYGTGNTQPTRLWTFSFIANSRNIYLNGTSIASDNNNTFLASWTGARIGSHPSPSDYYIGKIRELMIYSGTVNTTQRQTIEGYLSQKWGLGVSSTNPSTHPFYRFPPASLPFSPRNISGLQLWLDGADATTVTGTTSVTAWRDKSTNGYVANSFVNSVPNPSLVPNIRNGNGVIQYTAGNGSSIANFVLAQTMSIFKVYYPINQSIGSPFIEQGPNVNNESGFFFHSQNDNNFYIRAGSIGLANFGTTTVSNTWQMIEGINPDPANGNTVAFYVNGTTRASGGTQSDTTTITKTLYINGRGGANNLSYNTYLAELIIYNIGLTSSQRQQVEGYLAHKWGMSASLPSTHPYSKFPPP